MALVLLAALAATVLGIIGATIDGLGYLLWVCIAILVITTTLTIVGWARRTHDQPTR